MKVSVSRDYIYLPSIRHTIRLVEPLNSGGLLKAVYGEENNKIDSDSKILESMEKPIITPEESDNVFLSFNGDYTIENVILDCRQVRVGIWIKGGTVTLKNCRLIGDRKSSTGVGIAIAGRQDRFTSTSANVDVIFHPNHNIPLKSQFSPRITIFHS